MVDKKLPAVPETILKRRKRQAENKAARAKLAAASKVARHKKRVDIFKRAEKYVKEYREKERDEIRYTLDTNLLFLLPMAHQGSKSKQKSKRG
jgi:hypothetical protein